MNKLVYIPLFMFGEKNRRRKIKNCLVFVWRNYLSLLREKQQVSIKNNLLDLILVDMLKKHRQKEHFLMVASQE